VRNHSYDSKEKNTMYEIGRVCYKIAGRDSNLPCVIIDVTAKGILVDGATRRRVVNPLHIEPTTKIIKVSKEASTDVVVKALTDAGFGVPKKGAARQTPPRLKQMKKGSEVVQETKSAAKKPAKKAAVKKAKKE
jgi:large subunit ribosomal protein L14e